MEGFIPQPEQSNVVPVEPAAQVYICAGVPWGGNSDTKKRLFNSKTELFNYVTSKQIKKISLSSPVRWGKLTYAVEGNMEEFERANYLCFQNAPYTNDWKYAFITKISWQSANSAVIEFELDQWQNNIYDATIPPCFVERCHVKKSDDTIGSNLISEDLDTGEMICYDENFYDFDGLRIAIVVTSNSSGEGYDGRIENGVYSSAAMIIVNTAGQANEVLKEYETKQDAIVNMLMSPGICGNTSSEPPTSKTITVEKPEFSGGYIPKNNKIFTYPYSYVVADSGSGQSAIYRYELSGDADRRISFLIEGVKYSQPAVHIMPTNYRGLQNDYQSGFTMTNFPPCVWAYDAYQAWLSQNYGYNTMAPISTTANMLVSTAYGAMAGASAGSFFGGAYGMAGGAIAGAALSFIPSLTNAMTSLSALDDRKRVPDTVKGQMKSENYLASKNRVGITFYTMSLDTQFLQMIDNFWTVFGYPQKRIMEVPLKNRSSWDFVKTNDCAVLGNIMLEDRLYLEKLFNNGVFIFHVDDIGNFSLENN